MGEEVSGKLSSRVLNMKFMRQADNAAEALKVEEEKRQLVDSSEWKIPGNESIKARLQPSWTSVGATELLEQSQPVAALGRRKMGAPEKREEEKDKEELEALETLWQNQKRQREPEGLDNSEDNSVSKADESGTISKGKGNGQGKGASHARRKRAKSEKEAL
ncbi:LADA_0E13960g1_1 [Lachancea dasiensis]|uniref:LADA_0E13960g1_1 n=1 Tax=Lachancea dasiensis TaxID=1072105 RepID=A0A1G4JGC9_9SACH|nr:LADA_0E13960g1_1 [Lachancea dasiensis]